MTAVGRLPPADLPPVSPAGGGGLDCVSLLNSGFISGLYPSYLMSVKINLRGFLSIFLRVGGVRIAAMTRRVDLRAVGWFHIHAVGAIMTD